MSRPGKLSHVRLLAVVLIAVLLGAAAPPAALAQQAAVPVVFKNQNNAPLRVEIQSVVDSGGNVVAVNGTWDLPAHFFGYLTTRQGKVYAKAVNFRVLGPKASNSWSSKLVQVDQDGDFVVTFSPANYQEHLRLVGGAPAPAVAVVPASGNAAAVARVRAKIEGAPYARQALDIIHLGCKSDGATVRAVTNVKGADGQIRPGEFATVVRYHWTDLGGNKGWSELTYFFDARGRYLEFRVGKTTAVLLKHFDEAKLAVAALADLILPNIQNPQRRNQVRDLINSARIEDVFHIKMALDFP